MVALSRKRSTRTIIALGLVLGPSWAQTSLPAQNSTIGEYRT